MRNAFIGYTYQKQITLLLLAIMDVERNILKLDIEAKTNDSFDDVVVQTNSGNFQLQIKDFKDVSIDDLKINGSEILIKEKPHKLSSNHNIIFFNNIKIKPNDNFWGFQSYKINESISLVSFSRVQIEKKLNALYRNAPQRRNEIDRFFSIILDERKWEIFIEQLPPIKIFITKLQEKSISISHWLLKFDNLLLIEGLPGIGKSHFVNTLIKEFEHPLVYRFWIGNQDADYRERLKFENFIRDLNTKLFNDQISRQTGELLKKLKKQNIIFIIDGLDHVENYNKPHFKDFIDFIEKAKDFCRIIVLSRPLVYKLNWKKQTLENWNFKQTQLVLTKLFHLSDYGIVSDIFKISKGYPIIVKYLAEHYKAHKIVPEIEEVDNIDAYYQNIIANEKGKQSLSIFLCCTSYLTHSEIRQFIGDEAEYVNEFIAEHPYLFDIKLNRIALLHDSFNTFLRKQVNYQTKIEKVSEAVSLSILNLEKRFLFRFIFFQLTFNQKKEIITKYSSIETFECLIRNTIDFEAVIDFYDQLREQLVEFAPNDFKVIHYYDLSLILNLVIRDHISGLKPFYYTYVKSLIYNGVTEEEITSSRYLFSMYYYVKTKNSTLLLNTTANDNYDVERFHKDLEQEILKEERYITKHNRKLDKKSIQNALKDRINFRDYLTHIIENIFIHKSKIPGFEVLSSVAEDYLIGNTFKAISNLDQFLWKYNTPDYYPELILQTVYKNLISYGHRLDNNSNEFQDLSLEELIRKYNNLGSFNLHDKIHSYIRLALEENRIIDVRNIYPYWTMYHQRKDYTLYALTIALKKLNDDGYISMKECITFITKVQEVSEKGYNHLLSEFIQFYAPSKIIPYIEKNFVTSDLIVDWFRIPVKYINKISTLTYRNWETHVIKYHREYAIPLEEIENVFFLNKSEILEDTLVKYKKTISYKKNQLNMISKLTKFRLRFEEQPENDHSKYKQNRKQRLSEGFLNYEDGNFIKKMKLKPEEITKFADDNYTSLPEINVFKIYDPKQVSVGFKKILYNSITSKTKGSSYFHSLYYHPGNVLAMIKLYRKEEDFKIAAKSFEKFLTLSMFDIRINTK